MFKIFKKNKITKAQQKLVDDFERGFILQVDNGKDNKEILKREI